MSFKGFVCWRKEMIGTAMDTEALQTSRAIFLATHHPIRMYRASNVSGGTPEADDERRFLRDFMRPDGWVCAAVLGESGTGKSHLIRWLDINVPRDAHRKVLLIPKVGTNLKSIIRQILDGMVGPRFDEYRSRLDSSTQDRSEAEARLRLLTNLAIAVGDSQVRDRQLTEEQDYFAKRLPDFLLDSVFRAHLLADGGRIHELVTHAIGRAEGIERIDRPREFTVKDLPLEGLPDLANAGDSARKLHSLLLNDEKMVLAAIAWINEHLGVALRELLNMGGENLQDLMLDVREELAAQDVELVLLIEDFAKLQGIDRQLLEALLTREHQPGRRRLCALRTALAVTTGYFERLEDTVKTRISFRAVMDVTSSERGGLVTDEDVERFASRYLNAIRLPEPRLEHWASEREQTGEELPPNACTDCAKRTICHQSFGERDGIGLYPFNRIAVSRAVKRVSTGGRFNPRVLINRVMKETFEKYTGAIEAGEFPSPSLQQQFGAPSLSAFVAREARQRDPQHWRRRQVLLDLWTDGSKVVNLPAGVHEAFSLPMLTQDVEQLPSESAESDSLAPATPRAPASVAAPAVRQVPEALQESIKDLDDWQNGITPVLRQATANRVRPHVFRSIVEHIDWDAEFLLRGTFAGQAGCLFQQRYLDFSGSEDRTRAGAFRLNVPVVSSDLTDAALALQGLLQFEHHGHWKFENGSELWRAYAAQLERWSARLLEEIQRPTASSSAWDPVPAIIELLAVGARMHGLPSKAHPESAEFTAALFSDWGSGEADDTQTPSWRELAKALNKRRAGMVDQLLSRVACTKGGSPRVQIVDATRFVGPLRGIRGAWMPKEDIPDDVIGELRYLTDLQGQVKARLVDVVSGERARLMEWSNRMSEVLVENEREEVIGPLKALQSAAFDAALSPSLRSLDEAIEGFPGPSTVKALRETLARLKGATTLAQEISEVSRTTGAPMKAIEAVATAAERYMADTEARIESKRVELEQAGGGALDAAEAELAAVVDRLLQLLGSSDPGVEC